MKIKLIKRGVNVCERSVRNWMNDEGFTQRKTKFENVKIDQKRGVNVCERSVRNWMNDEGFTQRKTK